MDNLTEFKSFVKKNPTFANYIKDGSMTWQKFYELYDMYGEDSSIWNEFKEEVTKKNSPTISDIINLAKNIDIDKLQDGVNSLSKAVGLFSDLFASKETSNDIYKPRAVYRRFDD
jgi:hypothetical protein